tara:strand:+ start:276505 stop:278022 length:1518 start_codon:yes stop_codon:yes gene_type:complete
MTGNSTTTSSPILDEASRSFVRRALSAGLVQLDDVKKVVASLLAESDAFTPERLAKGLKGADLLTPWQAQKLLAGKSKGFYLGSYRLLRPLGKGGMGVVYLGEHHVMKRLMALKILPSDALRDARRIEQFKEEARASAQLDHPNIVRAVDFAEASGTLYIVMEFVDGIDLHCAVQRDGVMSVPIALDAMIQSTQGLVHAHERGIIHRDIKPSNLLLRTDGVVKVSDLGLARIGWTAADDPSSKNRLMGTADFVAPEQAINSKTVDARADIYSLGCTLFFLLTGKSPFSGATTAQRLAKHQTEPTPDVRKYRADCPAAVAELTMRMMAKRPEDRPNSAAELLTRLKRVAALVGGKPNTGLSEIASARDTMIDATVYQATIDDSSLSSDGEVPLIVAEVDELDFDSLPATPLPAAIPQSPLGRGPLTNAAPLSKPGGSKRKAPAKPSDIAAGHQQLLLGIGLSLAACALIAALGTAVYTLMRPMQETQQKIKALEQGKDGQNYIILK